MGASSRMSYRFVIALICFPIVFAWLPIDATIAQDFPVSTSFTNVGYIDPASIGNRMRVRLDAGFDMIPADRAEFFYAGRQPDGAANNVDYQELSTFIEWARNDWLSLFIEAPLRDVNPESARSSTGIADINTGFKVALLTTEYSYTTFQFRSYLPTGNDDRRLGTGNVSIEPGILQSLRLTDRLLVENELKTWVPLTSDDFAGTIMRYGIGISYINPDACQSQPSISPVFEVVGWSVLDGLKSLNSNTVVSADGDTIINAKLGIRMGYSDRQLYAGFGQALTSQNWYEQVLRLEYRVLF
jgi:hypothetical protein